MDLKAGLSVTITKPVTDHYNSSKMSWFKMFKDWSICNNNQTSNRPL